MSFQSTSPLHEIKNVSLAVRLTMGVALILVLIILAPLAFLNNFRITIQYPFMATLALIGSERVPDTHAHLFAILGRWARAFVMAIDIMIRKERLDQKIYQVRGVYSLSELIFGILLMASSWAILITGAHALDYSSQMVGVAFVTLCAFLNLIFFVFVTLSQILSLILWSVIGALVCISSATIGYFLMIYEFIRHLFGFAGFDPNKHNNSEFARYYASFQKINIGFSDKAKFSWEQVEYKRAGRIILQTIIFYIAISTMIYISIAVDVPETSQKFQTFMQTGTWP